MKKVYLVHGWGGSSKGGWFDWLKKELSKKKIRVYASDMPDTENPTIEKWVGFLEKNVKDIDNDTFFVGHSIGCQTILRFLERLPEKVKVGGAVFVAGWFNLKNLETPGDEKIAKPWIENKIDLNRVKKHTNNFLAIFSENDPFVPISDAKLFKEKLGAKIIIKKNKGHFDNIDRIEEILDFFKK